MMKTDRAKTQQQIFANMHRGLRTWNPKIPESPDRLDPILRILLQLYSHELSRIDRRISDLWERATISIIRSLNPECRRWPVPAYTVMRCDITDPVVDIDPHTQFFFREEREGGQTFFFSPLKTEKLIKATVRRLFLRSGENFIELSPSDKPGPADDAGMVFDGTALSQFYIGVTYEGRPADFTGSRVFLRGDSNALKQLRWAYWYPSASSGEFYEDSGFCPGLTCTIDDIVASDEDDDWGGLRTGASLFGQLEDNFVVIPEMFAQTWEPGPVPPDLAGQLMTDAADEQLYWIRVDLPEGGDKHNLSSPLGVFFDACVVVNRHELTLFKHTGGNQLLEIEIPESIDSILQISAVMDSSARHYLPRHRLHTDLNAGTYILEERGDQLALWFDFSSAQGLPPDSVTVYYAITAGIDANGIGVGKINELYESHPGISGGENLLPTGGAIPAKTESQIADEVASRLRNRDRALTFGEITRWAGSFDPRIKSAVCRNGVERIPAGVRRCIVVTLSLDLDKFCSEDEIRLLGTRMNAFLKSRAPVNTHFQVETAGI